MSKPMQDVCGSGDAGKPVAITSNKPLYQLRHLIAMLERQEAERQREQQIENHESFQP